MAVVGGKEDSQLGRMGEREYQLYRSLSLFFSWLGIAAIVTLEADVIWVAEGKEVLDFIAERAELAVADLG